MTREAAIALRRDAPEPYAECSAPPLRAAEVEAGASLSVEQYATVAFFSVEGIGPVTMGALRAEFGSLAEALDAPLERVLPVLRDDATRARLRAAGDLRALADRHLGRAAALGARLLLPGFPGWPRQLEGAPFPPLLYVLGHIAPGAPRAAIVGSRDSDAYGEELAAFFSAALTCGGASIVSGGALGIDAAAHRAALGNGGATVAVLGSGVDVPYPGEHRALFSEIVARGGAVVSHLPPGTPAVPQNFKVRNRVIAALSDAVLVARAGAASGALGTAHAARELGRPVFAVPGDVTAPLSAGVNALIESGDARLATGVAPIAAALSLSAADWPSAAPVAPSNSARPQARSKQGHVTTLPGRPTVQKRTAGIPPELQAVYEALGSEPIQFDELARRTGLDAAGLASALLRLEVIGLCEERVGKVFTRQ